MVHTLPLVIAFAMLLLVASMAAQFVVTKTFKTSFLREHHSVVEPLLGVVGTLYSVLLGFMVGGAMDRYEDCVGTVDQEANSMANVFRLSQGLHVTDRVRIRNLCRLYAEKVVEVEWGEMKHRTPVKGAFPVYQKLWAASLAVQPGDDNRLTNVQQSLLDSMKGLSENRRFRIIASQHSLTFAQWLVIGVGSAITVLFCLFFPVNRAGFQSFLTGLVAVSLGLNIWLLAAYSTPFSGGMQIQPYMFTLNGTRAISLPDTPSRYLRPDDKEDDDDTPKDAAKGKSADNAAQKAQAESNAADVSKNLDSFLKKNKW